MITTDLPDDNLEPIPLAFTRAARATLAPPRALTMIGLPFVRRAPDLERLRRQVVHLGQRFGAHAVRLHALPVWTPDRGRTAPGRSGTP